MMIFILFGIGVLIGFALQYALHKYNSQSKSSDESSTNEDRAMDWAALKKLVENLQSSVWSLKDLVDKARSENAFKSGGRNQMHPSKTSLSQDDSHVVLNPLIDRINTLNLEVSATREAGAFLVREFAAMKKEVGVDGLRGEVGIMTKRISGFENRLDKFAEDIQNVVTYIIPHIQPAPQEPVLQSNSQPSVVRLAPGQSSVAEQGTSGRKGVSEGRVEQRIGIQSVQSAAHLVAVLNGYLTEGTAGLRDWKSYNQLRDGLVNAGAEVCFAQLTRGESGEVKRSLTRFHGSENDFGSFWASGPGFLG